MFVRYFVELPLAAARVEEALLASPPGWLSAMAGAAQARGDELLTAVGVGPLGARTAPSWPSAPATARPWGWSAGPSTGCCSTGWPRRP